MTTETTPAAQDTTPPESTTAGAEADTTPPKSDTAAAETPTSKSDTAAAETPTSTPTSLESKPLESLTNETLRHLAAERGVELKGAKTKADIIARLTSAPLPGDVPIVIGEGLDARTLAFLEAHHVPVDRLIECEAEPTGLLRVVWRDCAGTIVGNFFPFEDVTR